MSHPRLRQFLRLRRSFFTVLGLVALGMVYVGVVLASHHWMRDQRVDLTEDHLYTLSPGTEHILGHLHKPIQLSLFFSEHATRDLPQLRSYEQRVREMLREMAARAHGKLHLKVIDPVPYSDDEDRAFGDGLTAVPGGSNGERVFFGLAGRSASGQTLSIPFFDPGKEAFLEYDIAKLIYELNAPSKPTVGVISSLPMDGDPLTGAKPWALMRQLHQLFDVKMIAPSKVGDRIDPDKIQVLLLVHPKQLSDQATYAIDQYVLHGGHLVVFVDPDAEMDARPVGQIAGTVAGSSSDLPRLFKAWGVAYDPDRVVLDRSRALSISLSGDSQQLRHPAMLGLTSQELNHDDVITASLQNINVSSAGYFELAANSNSRLTPLIQTTGDAMVVPAERVRLTSDPTSLFSGYQPNGEHYVLAARLRGTFNSAFPDHGGKHHLSKAPGPEQVVLVADTDLLSDRLWVQSTPFLGEQLLSAFANNADFVANIIDNLSGSSALLSVRGRAISQRPFTVVQQLRRAADQKFRVKERELEKELVATEHSLAALQPAKDSASNAPDDPNRKHQIDQYLKRKLEIRRQLREVQHQLDAEIDALGARIKAINILLVPALVVLAGLIFAWRRARRSRRPPAA
ncbi:Gldg family protein [Oleiagrimonas sp. C23AA]|uniref:GldG family protein n=1 Tax=Oleiagrimonas sp. C23AA TaxID=2719047 RepID=UPI0014213E60|nr:Gldg family protein [Oleiagrimonas sp. C23AA]NII11678.1 ABC transporter [Oleiagrimonas sp. C23AA]